MTCPRCGRLHVIERFTITGAGIAWAEGWRPTISGFLCDGWFYRVEAFQVNHEHMPVPVTG